MGIPCKGSDGQAIKHFKPTCIQGYTSNFILYVCSIDWLKAKSNRTIPYFMGKSMVSGSDFPFFVNPLMCTSDDRFRWMQIQNPNLGRCGLIKYQGGGMDLIDGMYMLLYASYISQYAM